MQQASNISKAMQLTQYSILSTFILVLLLQPITTVESATSSNHKTTLKDFIKKSCRVTLYSDLCYSSLSSSYTGDPDLGKLTYAAIKMSLTEAVHTTNYVRAMNNKTTNVAEEAIRDCVQLTKDAVSQVRKSLDETSRTLRRRVKRKRRLQMSNVQTWMSAAITDQNTCVDGFDDVGGRKDVVLVKNQVSGKVKMVVKFISNALALVNSFVRTAH